MITENALREQNVWEAIEKAEGLGKCEYVGPERPACVIGQLYTLEGGKLSELERWEGHMIGVILDSVEPELLSVYDRDLLEDLQYLWDCPDTGDTVEEVKARMKGRAREYFASITQGET